jgi:DNA-binding IscR family transcriptional regulator
VTGKLLTRSTGHNPVVVRMITLSMKKAGILKVQRGANGGSALSRSPEDISLFDIMEAVDPESIQDFVDCVHLGSSQICPVGRRIQEVLKDPYRRIAEVIEQEMRKITLDDLSRGISLEEIDIHKKNQFQIF